MERSRKRGTENYENAHETKIAMEKVQKLNQVEDLPV
jgi:hypothetical protein